MGVDSLLPRISLVSILKEIEVSKMPSEQVKGRFCTGMLRPVQAITMNFVPGLVLLVVMSATVAGCGESNPDRGQQGGPGPGSSSNPTADVKIVTVVSYAMYDVLQGLVGKQVQLFHPQVNVGQGIDRVTLGKIQNSRLILLEGTHNAGWIDTVSLPQSRVINTTFEVMDQLVMVDDLGSHSHGPGGQHSHQGIVAQTWLDPLIFGKQIELALSEMVAAKLLTKMEYAEAVQQWQGIRTQLEAQFAEMGSKVRAKVLTNAVGLEYLCRRLDWPLEVQPMAIAAQQDAVNLRRELSDWLKENPTGLIFLVSDQNKTLESAISKFAPRVLSVDLIQTQVTGSGWADRLGENLKKIEKFVDTFNL